MVRSAPPGSFTNAARTPALVATSEFPSRLFKKTRFAPSGYDTDFDSHFLRWMLSDGAGAMLLGNQAPTSGVALQLKWVHMRSFSGDFPVCMQVGFAGNGRPDVIVGNYLNSTVSVLLNSTAAGAVTPSLATAKTYNCTYPYSVTTADLNGDGRPDLVVANAFASTASVLLNKQYQGITAGSPATGTITHDVIFANGFE